MADIRTTLFADGMLDATVTNGVARITLAQSGADGKPIAVGQLCVPLIQLPALANGMVNYSSYVASVIECGHEPDFIVLERKVKG